MSGGATWLILIDSDEGVTPEAVLEALRRVPGAAVGGETALGVAVDFQGSAITVAYVDAPHVLVESRDVAERFGKAHREKWRIARATRRFEIGFQWADAQKVRDCLCDIESELALLVERRGGRTFAFNPQTEEFF
jgi:hypothetical protein